MNVGTISVWNVDDLPDVSDSMPMGDGMAMRGMSMPDDTPSTDEPPMPVATFRPFGARRGAVNLATTYQRQLGGQAQAVVAAWQLPREVVFAAIGLDNQVQTVKRRF